MDKMKQRDSQSTKGVDTGVGEGRSGPVDWHKVGVLADNVEFFASRLLRLKRESVEPFDRGGMSAEELQEHLHSNVGGLLDTLGTRSTEGIDTGVGGSGHKVSLKLGDGVLLRVAACILQDLADHAATTDDHEGERLYSLAGAVFVEALALDPSPALSLVRG